MGKTLETRVEALEAKTVDPEAELLDIVWDDRVPEPGTLVISWLPKAEVGNEPIGES